MSGLPPLFLPLLAALGVLAVVLVCWQLARARRRHAETVVIEFAKAFPGRCALCSFRRHAEMNGATLAPPQPHVCPENNSPPWPLPEAKAKWTRLV